MQVVGRGGEWGVRARAGIRFERQLICMYGLLRRRFRWPILTSQDTPLAFYFRSRATCSRREFCKSLITLSLSLRPFPANNTNRFSSCIYAGRRSRRMHAINPKSTTRFLLTAALCFFLSPPTALCEEVAKCYSPNGDLQINDVPCNPSTGAGGVSFCCGRGFTCLSNRVCMLSQDTSTGTVTRVGSTYRASCTDKSWKSTECPSFCTGE